MKRLCVRCRRAESVEDGRECHDCLNETLRETRPPRFEPAWRRWTREHNASKDMTGRLAA
jgi:hypothetical protein